MGVFRCLCRARSSRPPPQTLGQKGFYLQNNGLNPARSRACSRAMARHRAAFAGIKRPAVTAAGGWVLSRGRPQGQGTPSL